MAWSESVVTPEAVVLERDIAQLGSRFIGALVDLSIQAGVLLLAGVAAPALSPDAALATAVVAWFGAVFVYPTVSETVWRGRTVGKAAAKTRVIRVDGRPVTFPVVLVRNLLRLIDLLPGMYAIGAISILVTRRAQRLGDLAAGTIVVYDVRPAVPASLPPTPTAEARSLAGSIDAAGLSAEDYQVIRSFLLRRHTMEPHARTTLAERLASRFRDRVEGPPGATGEAFLEAAAAAYRGGA